MVVEIGVKYAIVYVNWVIRFLGDGLKLVREMVKVFEGSFIEILVVSVKFFDEVIEILLVGVYYLMLLFFVL